MFNRHFNTAVTARIVGEICRNHGFTNGLDCRYAEGHTVNLGRKYDHAQPDGSEYVNAAGYIIMKHNGVWRGKHTILWEQSHGQPVPEGHYIVFGDGNKSNLSIDNLHCVSASQSGILNNFKLRSEEPELAKVGVALAGLYATINKRKKKKNKK